jgi:4-amino-4-deoxy-L-arabinose transferase-like glycosyltransferase
LLSFRIVKKKVFSIFAIIIVLSLALRLYRVNLPLLEFYSVRQVYTADVTRNLVKSGFNLFYPQVSFFGPGPTYSLLEFPVYSGIVGIFYYLFGEFEIFGRLLSVLYFLLSSLVVFKIAKKYYGYTAGLAALFLFNFYPLGILTSRTFMPDNLMLLFSLLSIWYSIKVKEKFTSPDFLVLALLISLTILTKIQGLFTLIPVCYLLLTGKGVLKLKFKRLILLLLLSLFLPFLWYLRDFAVTFYGSKQFIRDTNWGTDFRYLLTFTYYRSTIQILYNSLTQTGLFLMILGLLLKVKGSETFIRYWLFGILLLFLIFDKHSSSHEYYQLVILPIAAILGAKVLVQFFKLIQKQGALPINIVAGIVAMLFIYLSLASVIARAYVLKPQFLPVIPASKLIQKYTTTQDLIINANDIGAQPIYYSKRKGWNVDLSQDKTPVQTAQYLKRQGAKFLIYIPAATVNSEGFLKYLRENFTLVDDDRAAYLFRL